jgi:pimeloyl-ACP methyl ester carboxylesterase
VRFVAGAIAVSVALGTFGMSGGLGARPRQAEAQTTAPPTQATGLRWRACGSSFQCTTFAVPLDYGAPDGPTIELALIRLPAREPSRRIGSLLMNPGGPGASAVEFVRAFAGSLDSDLRDHFDVVGVDPRGSGQSARVDCRFDMSSYYALDFSPDSADERSALIDGVQRFVDACVAAEGQKLRHVGTDDTVRDLERVRAALGDEKLTYLGFSYGTYIGAKYAAAYPGRVRALVLDGAVDPSLDAKEMQVEQSAGFERVLDGFLRWCARNRQCAFRRGGSTERAFDALRRRVDRDGLVVPRTQPPRLLSPTEFELGLAAILYEGVAGYADLGDALDAADRGDGRAIAALSDGYTNRTDEGTYRGIEQAFLAISCADGPPVGSLAEVRRIEAAAALVAPRTGPGIVNNSIACALWPFTGPEAAPIRAPDAPPILVVGTRRDPATPFAWAKSLSRQLESAVLISAPGAQHTAFGLGIDCVDDTVVRYLVDLEAPRRRLVC